MQLITLAAACLDIMLPRDNAGVLTAKRPLFHCLKHIEDKSVHSRVTVEYTAAVS